MKLDKIRFASLVGFISCRYALTLTQDDMREIDALVDVEMPQPEPYRATEASVDELLRQIANPDGYIPAIKAYRVLTGAGLKEAKQAIDRYRVANAPVHVASHDNDLGSILRSAKREVIND